MPPLNINLVGLFIEFAVKDDSATMKNVGAAKGVAMVSDGK